MAEVASTPKTVEKKTVGSWYAVVLGDPADPQRGASSGRFPAPDLGTECVCCNGADAEFMNYNPSTGPFRSSPLPIPLCAACRDHVQLNEKRALYLVAAMFAGGGLAVLGVFVNLYILIVGALVLAGAVGILLMDRKKLGARCESGHFSGLDIAAAPGVCSVRTTNHRVALHLIERHQGEILRVK